MSAAEYACIASLAAALCLLAVLAPFAAVRLRRAIADRRARRADRSAIALFSSLRSSGLLNSSSQCADAMLSTMQNPGARPDFSVVRAEISRCSSRSFVISWETRSAGFGELIFLLGDDGKWQVDTEGMSDKFCADVVMRLVQSLMSPPSSEN